MSRESMPRLAYQMALKTYSRVDKSPEEARAEEMETNVESVAARLRRMGFCPTTRLVELVNGGKLTPHQEAAVCKWLQEEEQKGNGVKVTGRIEHDHTHRAVSNVDDFLARHGLGVEEASSEETGPH